MSATRTGVWTIACFITLGGCHAASATQTKAKTGDTDMTQVIAMNGSGVAKITKDGEVWIGGEKAGAITHDGEIWVGGEKEGDITVDGEVWKAGEKVGDVTTRGEVWRNGNEVGTVEKDGTIWVDSSREGTFKGGNPRHAAVIVFYEFFETGE